ncbi:hypothetical protein [Rathayibacter tritici]|uniref:hypothetical protein n=1 Tax=Rathayibacter tritici TaxID=33888 RepID=UPI00082CEE98|nr:hypothetical protein [Rathayibacter tritici]PPI47809.1 hypothetical protein C5D18_02830 [Rathayibacter tritici]
MTNTWTIPKASTAAGATYFITSDGTLYHQEDVIAKNVTSAFGIVVPNGTDTATYVSGGKAYAVSASGTPTKITIQDSDKKDLTIKTAVGASYFITSDNSLYYKGTFIAKNVSSAFGIVVPNGTDTATFVSDGVAYGVVTGGKPTKVVIQDSNKKDLTIKTAVGASYYITSDNSLYYKGTFIAKNVSSAFGIVVPNGTDTATYVSDGVAYGVAGSGTPTQYTVPNPKTAAGAQYFLTTDGALYYKNDKMEDNVSSAFGIVVLNGTDTATYVVAPACQ